MLISKTYTSTHLLNSSFLKAYESLLAESQRQLTVDLPSLVKKLSVLDPEKSSAYSSQLEQFKRENQPKVLTVQLQLADQLSASPAPSVPLPFHSTKSIEIEKSKAPTFLGDNKLSRV